MSLSFFDKNNTTIERGSEKSCQMCGKQFGVFRKQHQCKRCFRAICSDCGKDRVMIYKPGFSRYPHRRCTKCGEEVKEVVEYINSNHLSFGKLSIIGTKWIKKIEKRPMAASVDDRKYKKLTREVFDRMWDSYNYTVREFIGMLIFELDQEDVYKVVYDVFTNVISACPEEEIEGMAYLIVFLLCFCSPDKVPIICFYLIELRNTVTDAKGLTQAYFKSLSFSEDTVGKTREFVGSKLRGYLCAFSVNVISIKSSIYIIDRVITRKKIDELYMFFCLSVDLIKEAIMLSKSGVNVELAMVRNCSIEATSVKYKQVNAVRSIMFIKEKREDYEEGNSSIVSAIEPNFSKQNRKGSAFANSFSEGISDNVRETIDFDQLKYEQEMRLKSAKPFRKKIGEREEEFPEDSFSMYSVIEEQKDAPKGANLEVGNQLLDLLYQVEQKSPNTSVENVNQNSFSLNQDTAESKVQQEDGRTKAKPAQRQAERQLQREQLRKANVRVEELKRQNRELKQAQSSKDKEVWRDQKRDYQVQIKKLKQSVTQYQTREREAQLSVMKVEELKRANKKQQTDVKFFQQQAQQANLTIKMLKNKLQTQSLSSVPMKQIGEGQQSARMLQMMKQSVREKNQQIQQLTKRNKLLVYQMEELSRNKTQDKEIIQATNKWKKEEKEKGELIEKMKELSLLLMQEEGEKLNLSEENFALRELLKARGISLQGFIY